MKVEKVIYLIVITLFLCAALALLWGATGYAPCSWYEVEVINDTEVRNVLITCLK